MRRYQLSVLYSIILYELYFCLALTSARLVIGSKLLYPVLWSRWAELNHSQRLEVSCTSQSKDGVGSELHLCQALTRLKIGFSPDWEK